MKKLKFIVMLLVASFLMFSCGKNKEEQSVENRVESKLTETNIEGKTMTPAPAPEQSPEKVISPVPAPGKLSTSSLSETKPKDKEIKVTFIELGSVRCIPCKMMQPVISEIEQQYKDQVKVVFYDVWTEQGRPYAEKYRIRVIPTQIFLDKDGNEYFRHEGYFPKEELVKVLKMKGVE